MENAAVEVGEGIAGWVAETPAGFSFTLKAPRRITHDSRLKNCGSHGFRIERRPAEPTTGPWPPWP